MTKNISDIIKRFYNGETEAHEEATLRDMLLNDGEKSIKSAEQTYFNYLDDNKIEVPTDIESIALSKINKQRRLEINRNIKIWIPRLSAAALLIIVFWIIKPEQSSTTYLSQQLNNEEKKEHLEDALKIVSESISGKKPEPEVLYNDDKFRIVIE